MTPFLIFVLFLPGSECSQALDVDIGDTVSCSGGILVPGPMAEDLLLCREIELPRCRAIATRETGVCDSNLKACGAQLDACNDALSKTDKLLDKSLENRKKLEWYKDPWMNIAIGVVVGAAVTSAAHTW